MVFPKSIEEDWDARNWQPLLEQNDQIAKILDSECRPVQSASVVKPDLRDYSIQHVTPERANT